MSACGDSHCITCSDDGVDDARAAARRGARCWRCARTTAASTQSVEVALVDGAAVGDALLVHAGTALARLGGPA